MTQATLASGTVTVTPDEQRLLEKLRQLSPASLPLVDQYLDLLSTREANAGAPDASTPARIADVLAGADFRRVLTNLPPATTELILEFATFVAADCLKWSYDDPASLRLSTTLMGLDPFILRENAAINREFEPTLANGLEPY